MSAGVDEATLERLRAEGDQPAPLFAEPRLCGYPPCGKPLVRKDGEKPSQFATRTVCDRICGARRASGSTVVGDPGDRACVCGGVMRRRDNESLARFSARKFCSPGCASRNTDRKTPRKPVTRRPVQTKTCTVCGGQMQRRASEGITKWGSRESCSISCAAKKRRAQEAAARGQAPASGRVCARSGCGKPLVQGVKEPPVRFAERRFCDRSCFNVGRRAVLPESKPCAGCPTLIQREGLLPYAWRAKRFCSPGCASRSRAGTRVEPKVAPSKDRDLLPVVERPTGPVWRPAGLSPTPNAWAGHRPQVSLRKDAS